MAGILTNLSELKPNQKNETMKTNSKAVRARIQTHILESVYDGEGNPFPDLAQAIAHLRAEFDRVANYPINRLRFPNNQDRFHDYLMGLPFHFEFENQAIADFLNGLEINPSGKSYTPEASAKLYTYLIFKEI